MRRFANILNLQNFVVSTVGNRCAKMYHQSVRKLVSRLLIFTLFRSVVFGLNVTATTHEIQKRGTPFLPLTFLKAGAVMNFVCGFGIPVDDLEYESVTSGIVFKSQHFLPGSLAALREHSMTNVHGRKTRSDVHQLANYRWLLYKFMESVLANLGYNGKSCVLRAICEAATLKLHHENGLLGELVHIVLTPTTSTDAANGEQFDYIAAERLGRRAANCSEAYSRCEKSFLSEYTQIFE